MKFYLLNFFVVNNYNIELRTEIQNPHSLIGDRRWSETTAQPTTLFIKT